MEAKDVSSVDDEKNTNFRDKNGEYFPVSLEGLMTGLTTEVDLFARMGESFFIVKPKNIDVDMRLLTRFKDGDPYLYIRNADREKYFSKLDGQISSVIKDPRRSVREKAGALTDYAVEIIDQIYKDPGNPQTMKAAKNLTQECVRFIGINRHAFLHLVELSGHDQYTYAHSVGVAAYTIALATEVLNPTPELLADMGLAGLLHDIGKCQVDPSIINKKGPLTEDEWGIMKKHPEYGADILRRHRNLSPIVALAAESHHEHMVGGGYPKGVIAQKLDPLVRIISLADAFSALTTKRSYSKARDNLTAMKLLKESLDKKFDATLFKPFVKLFLDPKKASEAA